MNVVVVGLAWVSKFDDGPHIDVHGQSDLRRDDHRGRVPRKIAAAVITGAQSGWRAHHAWQPETLAATLGAAKLRVDDRPAVTLTLAEYLAYADANDDERPLSIFDSEIVKLLAEDYTRPR